MHAQHVGEFEIVIYDQNADCAAVRHALAAFLEEATTTPKM
jgi:hypothetical protein